MNTERLVKILENAFPKSKIEYREDLKGVRDNEYRIALDEKDKHDHPFNIDIRIDADKFFEIIDKDRDNGKDSGGYYVTMLVDKIRDEFKLKYKLPEHHPFESVKIFIKWLEDSFGCVHCDHFDKNIDLPLNERKCLNEKVLNLNNKDYPKGVEWNKSEIRKDDIMLRKNGLKHNKKYWEKQPIKDVNEYFVCNYFKGEE